MNKVKEQPLEVKKEVLSTFASVTDRLSAAEATIASLKSQIAEVEKEKGTLEEDLMKILDLADKTGKWLAETQDRIVKITVFTQQKNVSWQSLYALVFSKLNAQTQAIVDAEVTKLREAAGEARKETIRVLKKGGSLWSIIQENWGKLKSTLGGVVDTITNSLTVIFIGSEEIDDTLTEIESIVEQGSVVDASIKACVAGASELKVTVDCDKSDVRKLVASIVGLGDSMAEQAIKLGYMKQLNKYAVIETWDAWWEDASDKDKKAAVEETGLPEEVVTMSVDEVYLGKHYLKIQEYYEANVKEGGKMPEVEIVAEKEVRVGTEVFTGDTSEEVLGKVVEHLESGCGCEAKAFQAIQAAVRGKIVSELREKKVRHPDSGYRMSAVNTSWKGSILIHDATSGAIGDLVIVGDTSEEFVQAMTTKLAGVHKITEAEALDRIEQAIMEKGMMDGVPLKQAVGWQNLPKGWTLDSVKTFWGSLTGDHKHKMTECVKRMKNAGLDNPEGFCASVKDMVEGSTGWRGR